MKKLFSSLAIATTLLVSATAAFADSRVADHRTERPAHLMIKPRPDLMREDVLASERASNRRGILTLDVRARAAGKNLVLVSSDDRLDIGFVRITYASGKTVMLRGTQARQLDIPDNGRIKSVQVSYVNRGARGAIVKLVARGDNDRRFPRGGRAGGGFGFGFGFGG
ncbi:MAG: hypothetical protein F9K40_05785 [Kofleriaceae bacterium]|nr:MAG: hypothetical protein F9K40_05785 [Kofleriaceae bacterium]